MKPTVGVIGVGKMGRGLARNIGRKGFELYVLDASEAAVVEQQKLGAKVARSIVELCKTCDVVVTCLPSVAAIRNTYMDKGGLIESARRGTTLIDCSTGDPDLAREISALAAKAGIAVLDAPMLRNPQAAWDGTLHLVVGGDDATLERVRPVLETFSERIIHVGPSGAGHVIKLVNNAVTICNTAILCEAFTLARRQGIDLGILKEVMDASMASSKSLHITAPRLIANDHHAAFDVDVAKKDITLYATLATTADVMSPIGSVVRDLLRLASANGYGRDHYSRIATILEGASGLDRGKAA